MVDTHSTRNLLGARKMQMLKRSMAGWQACRHPAGVRTASVLLAVCQYALLMDGRTVTCRGRRRLPIVHVFYIWWLGRADKRR